MTWKLAALCTLAPSLYITVASCNISKNRGPGAPLWALLIVNLLYELFFVIRLEARWSVHLRERLSTV